DLEAATVGVNWSLQKMDNLPFGRAVKGFVQMIPGLYTNQYDVGGNTKGGPAGLGVKTYGRSGGESVMYDGAMWDQTFGEYGSYGEVQVSTAAKGAEQANPGATVSFVVKSGGNELHGSFYGDWQDGSFQSNNVNDELLRRGFNPSGNKFTRYNDLTAEAGGPIQRDKFWFYASYGHTYVGQFVPGFISERTGEPAVFFTQLKSPTLKLTYQLTTNMKLETMGQFNRKWTPYRTGDQFTPLEATQNQISSGGVGPTAKWTYIINPKMTTDLSISRSGYWWPDYAWTDEVRKTDLTTTQNRGAYQRTYRRPIRWQWNGSWSWFTDIGGKNNEIKSGFLGYWNKSFVENIGYPNQQLYRYRSLAGDRDLFTRPDSVVVYDYPNTESSGIYYNSWFINDKIIWNRKLTMNVGLRFDRYSSWLPEQGNPGTGPWATRNIYPERRDFPVYNSWTPRFSFVYDVTGEGKLALKASYGRYAGAGSGINSASGPTSRLVNPAATIVRTYSNWNGTIPYIPRAQDLASVSGGGGTQRLDPALKPAYLDEYTAGIEVGLSRDYTIRFNVIRKMDYGGSKTLDLAMPFEAWTDVRYAADPGRDNVLGTADDGIMQTWSVPRSYPTFGQINRLITNVADNEGNDLYTAYELTFNKQFSGGWSLLGAYTTDFSKRRDNRPENPNQLLYRNELPEWYQSVKINGQKDLPWGFMYSSAYSAQQGQYYGREAQMRNALNQTVNILVEPRMGRYDWVKLWDNRISKTFQLNDRHSVEAIMDWFNTLNSSVVLTHVTRNGPNYLKVLATGQGATVALPIVPPRIFRLGVRWKF
ncbi:MAG: TonB-dependent receptor, partial [Acidobacteria bacterium]|nr:TonB-dependent receptor [Acidobacteriota bacterium]